MLNTEKRNPNSKNIDKSTTQEILQIIQAENINAVNAVGNVIVDITKACDIAYECYKNGGRIIYIGAGTSGRTGVIDAVECPPTYGIEQGKIIGVIAGGEKCMFRAAEGEEDNGDAGINDLKNINLSSLDVLIGISANGNAEYVIKALEYAKSLGSKTIGLTNNHGVKLESVPDVAIVVDSGAEVVTGSTRMKAGTVQKLVLNMISTTVMIKMGYVYENLMINLKAKNKKLIGRMVSIMQEIVEVSEQDALKFLADNNYDIKKAIESYKNQKKS